MDEVHVDTDSIQKAGIHREQDSNVNINIENPDTVPRNTDQEGNQANTNKKTPKKICIIGCRSWLVLVSGFMCFFLTDGFVFHTSVLFLELQDTFHKSKAETAIVQSVTTGAFLCGGVFSGFIITKLGVVRAGLVGASLDVIGLAASFFAPNIPYLVVCLGLTTGFGKCLIYQFGCTYVGLVFMGKEKLIALSIIAIGAGAGSIAFPFLIDFLSKQYGFRGALLILSGIMSHEFIIILYGSKTISNFDVTKTSDNSKSMEKQGRMSNICNNFWKSKSVKCFLAILRHRIFMVYMFALSSSLGVNAAVLIVFVDIFESKGFDRQTALFGYFVMSLTSLCTRILPGLLKKIPRVSIFDILILGVIFSAVGFGLFPFASSLSMNICIACMLGMYLGVTASLKSVGAMAILGSERFPFGQGITLTSMGIFALSGGPLIGLVKDQTDSYDGVMYAACGVSSTTVVILIIIRILRTKNNSKLVLKEENKNMDITV